MTLYYSSTKNLLIGFCAAFVSFAIFSTIIFNAEKLPDSLALTGIIATTVLAWVGVICLHKATFGRQY